MLVRDALEKAVESLASSPAGGDDPRLVARILMKHFLDTDASGLMLRSEEDIGDKGLARFFQKVERARTMSVFRVVGAREFHGLQLGLNSATLEPRDDTETLVECVLNRLQQAQGGLGASWRFADLGTGTGAIALALLSELPSAQATLTDFSQDALDKARVNAKGNGLESRCSFVQGDWLAALDSKYDCIVSNPPYIASEVIKSLDPVVRDHDPRNALDGGADGLDAYRVLIAGCRNFLKLNGFLALEIGYDQAEAVQALAEECGWTCEGVVRDLNGCHRAMILV
ncbi:MAG: peptide chain release factor N(5)-glutamine methyltransferase [Pseudomonadota bacterium]